MSNFFSPVLGISTGDPNGIGIEVILKSLEKINFIGKFTPVIFSNYKLIEEQKKIFNLDCEIISIDNIKNLSRDCINVLNLNNKNFNIEFGKSKIEGGEFSRLSLRRAVEFLKKSNIIFISCVPGAPLVKSIGCILLDRLIRSFLVL